MKSATRCLTKCVALLAAFAVMAGAATGCSWSIGGGTKAESRVSPTRGQELMDLKRALDRGAIDPEEYEAQKKKVMER